MDADGKIGLAVIVALVVIPLFVATGILDKPTGPAVPQGTWLYHYQSLVGGVLAFIGAAATIFFLAAQIKLQREQMDVAIVPARVQLATAAFSVTRKLVAARLQISPADEHTPPPYFKSFINAMRMVLTTFADPDYRTVTQFLRSDRISECDKLIVRVTELLEEWERESYTDTDWAPDDAERLWRDMEPAIRELASIQERTKIRLEGT